MEVDATYGYLSTVTRPLAERGYYVFPVAVVDRMLRENGLPGPAEMHTVSLEKIDEIFGADAVLYLRITEWGTSYMVLSSSTEVRIEASLVDVATGTELWSGSHYAVHSSGGGSLVEMAANALVSQVASSFDDRARGVARQANQSLFWDRDRGLLLGAYHPDHGTDTEETP